MEKKEVYIRKLKQLFGSVLLIFLAAVLMPEIVKAHSIPSYQEKDIFAEDRVKISGIPVNEVTNPTVHPIVTRPAPQPVTFKIFNSTRQEIEQTVETQNGTLPDLYLINDHNYIIFAEDAAYRMNNVYVWIKDGKMVDIKTAEYTYQEVRELRIYKRESQNPELDRRVTAEIPILYWAGDGAVPNVKVKLVSDIEMIETVCTDDGKLVLADGDGTQYPRLLEDVTYMVVVEDETYGVASFPLAPKDKAEYMEGKFFYDHSDCKRVDVGKHYLVNKADVHKDDTMITSATGNTTVAGLNFKDFLVLEKKLDKSLIDGMESKDYDVVDIKIVNPHRWEVSKLAAGEFTVTEKIDSGKIVSKVYYVDKQNMLKELDFELADDNAVRFTMNSLSLYPIVFEYGDGELESVKSELQNMVAEKISYNEADYTVKSWEAYSSAVEEAAILLENPASTYRQLQLALQKAEKAKNALVKNENKVSEETRTALNAALAEAETYKQTDYTDDSWKPFIKAVKAAKKLAADEDATEMDCRTAITEIESTKKALIKRGSNKPKDIKISKLTISTSSSYKIAAGKKVQLTAGITPANVSNKSVEWKSSNTKYATVDSAGKVTTKKAGAGKTVVITVSAKDGSGQKSECQIKIMKHAVKSVKLKAKKSVKAGKSLKVKATVKTTGKKVNKTLKWTSSNTKYATVNSKGKVSIKKAGKGKIVKITARATDGSNKKATIKIKIK